MQRTTKDEILHLLIQAKEQPISGQVIADRLHMSRTAIWKHMQTLQAEGYEIDIVKKHGYVLKGHKENKLSASEITTHLTTKQFGRSLYVYDCVESTQLVAHQLVSENVPNGTVIVAEQQTAGRGRMQREWDSAAHKGLWFTTIVRPNCLPHEAPQFTLIAAVAVVNAIKALYPSIQPQIKWPNDLLINGRKTTGILTEMIAETDRIKALLIGIGINVNHVMEDFPESLHEIATSLQLQLDGKEVNRALLLAEILKYLENYSDLYLKHGFARIKPLWEESSCTIGQTIRATTLKETIYGKAIGITEQGVLEIVKDNGEIVHVYSADIEII